MRHISYGTVGTGTYYRFSTVLSVNIGQELELEPESEPETKLWTKVEPELEPEPKINNFGSAALIKIVNMF